eukprot:SAG31_NODE_113_length_24342_cov_5.194530_3_plen_1021_part_00
MTPEHVALGRVLTFFALHGAHASSRLRRANRAVDLNHIRIGPTHLDRGDHEIEVLGFEDCCDSKLEIEIHLPCDGPVDDLALWRSLFSGDSDCLLCGQNLQTLECYSQETAVSSDLYGMKGGGIPEADTRHAICGSDKQWHGSFPQCIRCNASDVAAGDCGGLCAFPIDAAPPIPHASWGNCTPGGTLAIGEGCSFLCDEGFVSYARQGKLGRPRARCSSIGMREVEIVTEGQCTNPQCIDDGRWATEFPSAAGKITAPIHCSTDTNFLACRREHASNLTVDTQEAARRDALAEQQEAEQQAAMYAGSNRQFQSLHFNDDSATHVLAYSIETTARLHTMFDDGQHESQSISQVRGPLPAPGAPVTFAQTSEQSNANHNHRRSMQHIYGQSFESRSSHTAAPTMVWPECDSRVDLHKFFEYVRKVCCEQVGERCFNDDMMPASCSHVACARAVQHMAFRCLPFLRGDYLVHEYLVHLDATISICRGVNIVSEIPVVRLMTGQDQLEQFSGCEGTVVHPGVRNRVFANNDGPQVFEALIRSPPFYSLQFRFSEFALSNLSTLSLWDENQLLGNFRGTEIPEDLIVRGGTARLSLRTIGGPDVLAAQFSCVCSDTVGWESEGRGCEQYASSSEISRSACKFDVGHTNRSEQLAAIDACPETCGRCTGCIGSSCDGDHTMDRSFRRSMQHDGGDVAMAGSTSTFQSSSSSDVEHPFPNATVVGHAIESEVVVHAPTLASAQNNLCRVIARSTNASCCLLPSDCTSGVPMRCQQLCASAVNVPPPAHCLSLDWFRSWHEELAALCAGSIPPVFICGGTLPIDACNKTVVFDTRRSDANTCDAVISAPSNQVIRLTMDDSSVGLQPSSTVHIFDGASMNDELAMFDGLHWRVIDATDVLDNEASADTCPHELATRSIVMDQVCCRPPATCASHTPSECTPSCAQLFLPFYNNSRCSSWFRDQSPELTPFLEQCMKTPLLVESISSTIHVELHSVSSSHSDAQNGARHGTFSIGFECADRHARDHGH